MTFQAHGAIFFKHVFTIMQKQVTVKENHLVFWSVMCVTHVHSAISFIAVDLSCWYEYWDQAL